MATEQIRRALLRVAERLRAKTQNGSGEGVAAQVLRTIADELEAEALGKKLKGGEK